MSDKNTQNANNFSDHTTMDVNNAANNAVSTTKSAKRIVAWICIILIILLYVLTLILAILGKGIHDPLFAGCLMLDIFPPIFAYIVIFLVGRRQGKHIIGDPYDSQKRPS